ncbi:hypothetical protein ACEUZ9_002858 [Paracoccus litorisediminis]|uniref:hypothetical protein n=1 Tax=Paracoccus litorisediminis TaxID=2006130 RepID=UPI0037326D4C
MTLGKKLAQTLEEARLTGIRADELRNAQQLEKIRKQREEHAGLIDTIKGEVTLAVEKGLVPKVQVRNYDRQGWLRSWQKGKGANQDLFDGLLAWAAENEIRLIFNEDHDGIGMESWITVRVEPVEPDMSPSPN